MHLKRIDGAQLVTEMLARFPAPQDEPPAYPDPTDRAAVAAFIAKKLGAAEGASKEPTSDGSRDI